MKYSTLKKDASEAVEPQCMLKATVVSRSEEESARKDPRIQNSPKPWRLKLRPLWRGLDSHLNLQVTSVKRLSRGGEWSAGIACPVAKEH